MAQFLKNITFHSIQVDLSKWGFGGQLDNIRNKIQEMLNEGIIKPIKRTIFHYNEVESAFRWVKHFPFFHENLKSSTHRNYTAEIIFSSLYADIWLLESI